MQSQHAQRACTRVFPALVAAVVGLSCASGPDLGEVTPTPPASPLRYAAEPAGSGTSEADPDCGKRLQGRPLLGEQPWLGDVLAAKASTDGYALLALQPVEVRRPVQLAPQLALVDTPRGRTFADLQRTLPHPSVPVRALSEIREGRVLVVQNPFEARPTITQLDLSRSGVVWTRTLQRDAASPPASDAQHADAGATDTADTSTEVLQVALQADGRYVVLARSIDEGTYLLGFTADGALSYRASVLPAFRGFIAPPSFLARPDGSIALTVSVDPEWRDDFEALHGITLAQVRTNADIGVLLQFSPAGALLSSHETVLPTRKGYLERGLVVQQRRLTWFAREAEVAQRLLASLGGEERDVRIAASALSTTTDTLDALVAMDDQLYVTGSTEVLTGFKTLATGAPYIARMAPDGSLAARCVLPTRRNTIPATYTAHASDVPLLVVTDIQETSKRVRVYRLSALRL